MIKSLFSFFLICFCAASVQAKVVLPNIFAHHMVLQRAKPVAIWGTAAAGEKVMVLFETQKKEAIADANGNWMLFLEPLKANAKGQQLYIQGSNRIELNDVLVGEVWICSGQSNMEYQMRKITKEATRPIKGRYYPKNEWEEAHNDAIRIFLVNRKALPKPDENYDGWNVATGKPLYNFSATGYFFAKQLNRQLGIPVGMISSAVSGSRIEPWVEASALKTGFFKGQQVGGDPGKFFETMILPLAPFSIRGFLWYQGETNTFLNEKLTYAYKMKALINSWRMTWKDKDLPFYYTQIAPFLYSKGGDKSLTEYALPELREAQTAILKIPHTGMIITTDLTDHTNDIHPTYKWEVGRRLALQALKKTYGLDVVADGPVIKSVEFENGTALINYQQPENGLISLDGKPLSWFEIAGKDGKFYPAEAAIQGQQVVVRSVRVEKPVQLRFGWNEVAQPNLFNQHGLPAAPYRTKSQINEKFNAANN